MPELAAGSAVEQAPSVWADRRQERLGIIAKFRAAHDLLADTDGAETFSFDKRAEAIYLCGSRPGGFHVSATGAKAEHLQCRDRLCPVCSVLLSAKVKDVLVGLVTKSLAQGERLFFTTLTIRHNSDDALRDLRGLLGKAWSRGTKRKFFRETVAEYHRKAEVELTTANGWHPHYHFLFQMRRDAKAWYWGRDKIEREFEEWWKDVTGKVGRRSYQVTVNELERDPAKPGYAIIRQYDRKAKRALPERSVTIAEAVAEIVKYVTKKQTTGAKPGQVGVFDYTPQQFAEYAEGLRHWKLHRSSKQWAAAEKAADELEQQQAQAKQAAAGERWLSVDECNEIAKQALAGALDEPALGSWRSDAPKIYAAMRAQECWDYKLAENIRKFLWPGCLPEPGVPEFQVPELTPPPAQPPPVGQRSLFNETQRTVGLSERARVEG